MGKQFICKDILVITAGDIKVNKLEKLISNCFSYFSSNVEQRIMLTGDHWVRDVHCKKCQNKLGWMYEFATEDTQRYKEARTILEKALVMEKDGIEDHVPMDP